MGAHNDAVERTKEAFRDLEFEYVDRKTGLFWGNDKMADIGYLCNLEGLTEIFLDKLRTVIDIVDKATPVPNQES